MQHLAALGLVQAQLRRQRGQLCFGGIGRTPRQARQALGGDYAAARVLGPVRGACVRRVDEIGVVAHARGLGGRQAGREVAHQAGLAFGDGQVDALPALFGAELAQALERFERHVAARRQRARAQPQGQAVGDPRGVGGAGGQACGQVGATQLGRFAAAVVGAEVGPVAAPGEFQQPAFAQPVGRRLAVEGLQHRADLVRTRGGQVPPQRRGLDPAAQRVVGDARLVL